MTEYPEKEEYWHWFHGLQGISPKEKEELLRLWPGAEQWYEAGKTGKAEELLGPICEETEKQKERRKQIITVLEDEKQRDELRKGYEAAKKKGICLAGAVCNMAGNFLGAELAVKQGARITRPVPSSKERIRKR